MTNLEKGVGDVEREKSNFQRTRKSTLKLDKIGTERVQDVQDR